MAAVDFSKSTLQNTPDDELVARLDKILEAVSGIAGPGLSAYGLPPNALSAAQAAVVEFGQHKTAPREAIIAHKTTTGSIPQMMNDGKNVLVVLDNLVHLYDDTDPVFVGNYRNARIIVDGGVGHTPPPPPPTH